MRLMILCDHIDHNDTAIVTALVTLPANGTEGVQASCCSGGGSVCGCRAVGGVPLRRRPARPAAPPAAPHQQVELTDVELDVDESHTEVRAG